MNLIQTLNKEQAERLSAGKTIPDFEPGDTVIVNVKVVEGERTRVQAYEGVCIGRSGHGLNESFTVRKISYGEGVERVFPLLSPMIDSIKLVRRGKVRRAKLYYLRGLRGKAARISEGTHHAGQGKDVDAEREVEFGDTVTSKQKGRLVRPFSFAMFHRSGFAVLGSMALAGAAAAEPLTIQLIDAGLDHDRATVPIVTFVMSKASQAAFAGSPRRISAARSSSVSTGRRYRRR